MNKIQFDDSEPPMRQIRKALGMTQMKFAQELGIQQTTVARWERGERSPMFTIRQVKALERLLKGIGVKISDLPDELGKNQ